MSNRPTASAPIIASQIRIDFSSLSRDLNVATNMVAQTTKRWSSLFNSIGVSSDLSARRLSANFRNVQQAANAATTNIKREFSELRTDSTLTGTTIKNSLSPATANLNQLRTSARRATSSIRELATASKGVKIQAPQTPLRTQIQQNSGGSNIPAFAGGVGAGLLGAFGIKAADDIRLLRIRYEELEGSQAAAAQTMEQVANAARRVGAPIRATQQAFLGLIPSVRDAGENVDDYMQLALRLATLNPGEGLEGSIFAIREALSSGGTDLVSLSERFNLPRVALRELIQETGSFSKALDITLDRYGATQAAAEANAKSLRNLGAVLRDTFARKLEGGFAPVLELIANGLIALNDLLERLPDSTVSAGVSFALVVGAILAVNKAVQTLTAGYYGLATSIGAAGAAQTSFNQSAAGVGKASLGSRAVGGLGMSINALTVTAGSIFFGAQAGLAVANALGELFDNQALKEADNDSIIESIKQLMFLGATAMYEAIGEFLVKPLSTLRHIILNFGSIFNNVIGQIEIAVGGLIVSFADLIADLNSKTKGIFGLGNAEDLVARGENLRLTGQLRQTPVMETIGDGLNADLAAWEIFSENMLAEYAKWLGILEEVPEEMAEINNDAELEANRLKRTLAEKMIPEIQKFVDAFDERLSFAQDLEELSETGDPEAMIQRLDAMEREERIIKSMLPSLEEQLKKLEDYKDVSDEAAKLYEDLTNKVEGYNDRLKTISEQIPQLVEVLAQRLTATIEDLESEAAKERQKIEDDRNEKLKDIRQKADENIAEQAKAFEDKRQDLEEKSLKDREKYQETIEDIERDHRKRVLQINKDFARDLVLAASKLDASGVAAAIIARGDGLAASQETRDESINDANENLQASEVAHQKELQALQLANQAKLNEINNALQTEINKVNEASNQQLNDLQMRVNAEIQTLQTSHAQQLAELQRFLGVENSLKNQSHQNAITRAVELAKAMGAMAQVMNAVGNLFGTSPFGNAETLAQAAATIAPTPAPTPSNTRTQNYNNNNSFNIASNNPQDVANAVRDELKRLSNTVTRW